HGSFGRIPGTWVLSAQGAHTASGDYVEVILLTALVVTLALPLYYDRNRLVEWFRGNQIRSADGGPGGKEQKHLRPNLSFFGGCVQRDSLSLSFWRLTRWVGGRRRAAHTPGFLTGSPSLHKTPISDKFWLAVPLP